MSVQVSKLKPIKEENIIKVNRPRKLIITPRQAEEGKVSDERIAKVSGEFSVNIKHDDIILAQSMFNNKLRGTLEENAKELENINWGGYDVEKIVDALYAISISLSDGMDIPYQRMITKRIFRALLLNESNPITVLLARQAGKCLARGTLVMMFDGSSKKVEDIQIGDLLMGDDSTPRKVLSLASGKEEMYKIKPKGKYAESYTVNKSHILSLYDKGRNKIIDMPLVNALQNKKKLEQSTLLGYKVAVDFSGRELPLDPYFLGIWLGDGSNYDTKITISDPEILDYVHKIADSYNLHVLVDEQYEKYGTYRLSSGRDVSFNPIKNTLNRYELFRNKHIPHEYKTSSKSQRKQLLAGLIDSDGHISKIPGKENVCDLIFVNKTLAEDIQWLARSLGFRCSLSPCKKGIKDLNFEGTYYRLNMYGDFSEIPMKVERKKVKNAKLFHDPTKYGISIEEEGIGEYFGFEIDGNKRFLLSDFTVTHNTEVSGRTGVTCCGVMPALARIFPEQLSMYDKGFWIGVYAPSGEQADTLYRRMKAMAARESASAVFNDPDIAADLDKRSGARWSNNSFIHAQSASPRSSIEGKTLHLCLIDECQDMDANVLEKSIFPMMAWTNGLPVMTGTVNDKISYYYQQIVRNKDMGLVLPADRQLHFQFDYKEVIKYNPRYAKHIETEKIKNGEDSLFFKMSYGLEWPHMKSNTFTPQDLQRYSLVRERELKTYGTGRFVAGIDLASKRASTVVTVLEIEETQMLFSDGIREAVHSVAICDWLELTGMPYQDQRDSINSFLAGYEGLEAVVVDTTGVGDPVMEQMESEWNLNARLLPFIFSSSTKDKLAKIFDEFFYSNRLIIPSDDHARRTARWQSFYLQFLSLTKVQLNNFSYYAKQVENKKARDDYFDSLCLALYGVKNSLEFGSGVEVLPYQLKALNSNRGAGRGYSNIDDLRKAARSGNHIPLVERNKKYRRIPKILED
jgi:hypothetical protein